MAAVAKDHELSGLKQHISLTVLGTRSPRSVCWQGATLSEGSRGVSFLAFSWLLASASNPWFICTSLQPLPPSSHGFLPGSIPVFASQFPVILDVVCVYSAAQSFSILCDPVDYRPPGSSVYGIFQARILEWVAISSSRGSSRPRDGTRISCVSCMGR